MARVVVISVEGDDALWVADLDAGTVCLFRLPSRAG